MEVFPAARTVSIEKTSGLGFGLRLTAGDKKVEWNLTHYLEELEQAVLAALSPGDRENE